MEKEIIIVLILLLNSMVLFMFADNLGWLGVGIQIGYALTLILKGIV